MGWIHCLLILLASFLQPEGNCALPEKQHIRVVTQINVTAIQEGLPKSYCFREPEELKRMLDYLRLLPADGRVDVAPESFRADTYEIILRYSDGNSNIYRQIYGDYLQKDQSKWMRIDDSADLLFPPL